MVDLVAGFIGELFEPFISALRYIGGHLFNFFVSTCSHLLKSYGLFLLFPDYLL